MTLVSWIDFNMVNTQKSTPKLVVLLTGIAILGAFFPVYGIPFGPIKLTVFRLGVFPLVMTQLGSLFKDNKRLTILFTLFFLMRLFSLIWAEDMSNGIKQLDWFFEGCCLLFSVKAALNKYPDFEKIFTWLVITIGGVAILFIFLQAILYFGMGYKIYVPFTQNIPELASDEQFWNYPIYGAGRIIGPFYEPNMSGSMCCYYFALLLPLVTGIAKKYRKWLVLPVIILVAASLFTGSRQSAVSIVLSTFIYFAYFAKNKARALMVFAIIILILSAVLIKYWDLVSTLFEESENVLSRFSGGSGGSDDSDISGGRFAYMERVWAEFGLSHLLFGAGEGVTHGGGHNVFLAVFLENGIFTFFVFLIMLWKLWKTALTSYKRNPIPINVSSCLIVISWVFLMFVNWAQLNQSQSFVYLCFIFLSSSVFMKKKRYGSNIDNRTVHATQKSPE